ncbi:alpha/beta hydrolase fold domain-containing protein [Spirillospora sp. NPDC048819]|uniref:alpha/beta hydrolase fold domain-containing protein n=1 Tax=Spirillospora sp. NPDC048819 TaxID=3155268 RepID=UPI0033F4D72B
MNQRGSPDRDAEDGATLSTLRAPDAIELRHLRAFVAVAEELNFGRAAARLFISQPALSRQVRALERLVGCPLLRRSTHRVELALAGEVLLERAQRVLADVDQAVSATRSVGGELESRIARMWEPLLDLAAGDAGLQAMRDGNEELLAKFEPPEVGVRPVNAGGVQALQLDPAPDAPLGLLYLHGGGFVMGSAYGYRPLAGALAVAAGVSTLVADYRLAPEHPFPAAVEDALRAYVWILDRGTPPEELAVAGDSSGAGLALSLLLSLRQQDLPLPGRVVLLSPGVDIGRVVLGPPSGDDAMTDVQRDQVSSFRDLYLGPHPVDDPLASPLNADLTGFPPMLIQVGTGDTFSDEAHALADLAHEHGVDARLELYPAEAHVFHLFWSFLPEAADALEQAGRFVRELRTNAVAVTADAEQGADTA